MKKYCALFVIFLICVEVFSEVPLKPLESSNLPVQCQEPVTATQPELKCVCFPDSGLSEDMAIYPLNLERNERDLVFEEDFEGYCWPFTPWTTDMYGYAAGWDDDDERAHTGSESCYCAGGGIYGINGPGPYRNNMDSWARGYCNLSNYDHARSSYWVWYEIEEDDSLFIGMSNTEHGYFWGYWYHSSSNGWKKRWQDISEYTGDSFVYFGMHFKSDSWGNAEGAYVDDIAVHGTNGFIDLEDTYPYYHGYYENTYHLWVEFDIENFGTNTCTDDFYVGYYLSVDNILDNGDYLIGNELVTQNLNPNGSNSVTVETDIYLDETSVPYGLYSLYVYVDYLDTVIETDEYNNRFYWDDAVDYQEVYELSISPSSHNSPWQGDSFNISVESNGAWSVDISGNCNWLTYSGNSNYGNDSFTVTVEENPTLYSRSAHVYVEGSNYPYPDEYSCLVTQTGQDYFLEIEPTAVEIIDDGESFDLSINSNANWFIYSNQNWIIGNTSAGSGNDIRTFTIEPNSTFLERTGQINVHRNNINCYCNITQAGTEPYLEVSPAYHQSPVAGETFNLEITSNVSWAITDDQDWISYNNAYGGGNYISPIIIEPNLNRTERTGTVTVSQMNGELEAFCEISQLFPTTQYSIDIEETSNCLNDTACVCINTSFIPEYDNIDHYQFTLDYDQSLIEYFGYSLDQTISSSGSLDVQNNSDSLVVSFDSQQFISGEGTLVKLLFVCSDIGTSNLHPHDFFYNQTQVDILFDGSITVTPNYPDWEINPPDYEYNGSIWGQVMLFDEVVTSTNGMLGCFADEECRGIASFENGSIIDYTEIFGYIVFFPMLYSNNTSGDIIHFEYYDAATDQIYPVMETIEFNADMVVGNGYDPYIWHASDNFQIEISKDMPAGWNWFSVNLLNQNMSTDSVLASLDNNCLSIKDQIESSVYYDGLGWFGSLQEINNHSLYKLEMGNPATWQFSGMPIDPSETVYDLFSGWNWISYASQEAEEINYALGSIENGVSIKNQTQNAVYYDGIGWFGSLEYLQPLEGYMLEIAAPDTLIYPEPLPVIRSEITYPDFAVSETGWQVNPHDFEYNGVVIAQIESDDDLSAMDYELAVFCEDECRGIAEILDFTESFDGTFHSLMIYSNLQEGEQLSFNIYDRMNDIIIPVETSLTFTADMFNGDYLEPVIIQLPSVTYNEDTPQASRILSCYPNPFNPETTITFFTTESTENTELCIYNLKGQKVCTLFNGILEAGEHSITWKAENLSSGIYLLKFKCSDKCEKRKLILIK